MFAITRAFLLIVLSLCHGAPTNDRPCAPDTIDFATKVAKSSVVVYGKAMAKIMDEGSESTFHVFFQVDCILKGPATLRQINITNAGHIEGKEYCQEFSVGRGYSIAFLEPHSSNETDHKTFIPADFVEIHDEGNSTDQLLASTCNLHRLVPLQSSASVTEICPAVATDPICHQILNVTAIVEALPLVNTTLMVDLVEITNTSKTTILLPGDKGSSIHIIRTPQQELDAIRSKSSVGQVNVDGKNGTESMNFSILLLIMAIFFCSNSK